MAKIIKTVTKPTFGIKITNYFTKDGKPANDFTEIYAGDLVNKLAYVKDEQVVSLSGKMSDVNIYFNKATVKPGFSEGSFLSSDASVVNVTIDHSTKNNSLVDVVPAKDILEYNTEETEIDKVKVTPIIKVDFAVTLSDGTTSTATFKENDILFGMVIVTDKNETISGDFEITAFNYKLNSVGKLVLIGLVLVGEGKAFKIAFRNIKSAGKEGVVVTDAEDITNAIEENMGNEDVGGVVLPEGSVTDEIAITGNINIVAEGTSFENTLTVSSGATVSISGAEITEDSRLVVNDAESVVLKDCTFKANKPYQKKSYLILGSQNEDPVLLQIDGCRFEDTLVSDNNDAYYNLFELNSVLADGSYVKNCYFTEAACNHNVINLYNVEDGATITIENNVFEKSANAVRIGFKGDAHCTVNLTNNKYLKTDADVSCAGLLIIQPYVKATTSMANVNINIDGTINESGVDQIAYIFYNDTDTHLTGELVPNTKINGVKVDLPELTY